MKNKILLFVAFASIATTLYPAKIFIENATQETVWALVNNQKRTEIRSDVDRHWWWWVPEVQSFGAMELARIALSQFPNFFEIKPGKTILLGTALLKVPREAGLSPEAIRTVTFLRKKGETAVTGTFAILQEQLEPITEKYGLTALGIDCIRGRMRKTFWGRIPKFRCDSLKVRYIPLEGPVRLWPYEIGRKYTIKIPNAESFVYDFGKNPVRTKRTIRLTSWGTVEEVKK